MGEVIYGIVFGKITEVGSTAPDLDASVSILPSIRVERFSDDVFYMSPPIELPCDTEPTNEPA